jgi:hypothetical protein
MACALTESASAGVLRAGAGRVSITPEGEEFPFTAPHERTYYGVHDEVCARALALEDEKQNRVVVVSLEVTEVPRAHEIVAEVAKAAAVAESHVLVTATHTHNSLLVSYHGGEPAPVHAREMARVEQAAVEAAKQAVSRLQSAHIVFGRGEAYVDVNNGEAAGHKSWNDAKGFSDKTLDVLRLVSDKNEPIALLVNYATHGEVMFRSVTKNDGYEVSGDLPGAVSRYLEGRADAAPVVLFTSAAEGDQLPIFKSLQPSEHFEQTDEGASGWALLDVEARRLADATLDVTGNASVINAATLTAAATTVECPGKKRNASPEQADAYAVPPVSIPLSLIRIGDVTLEGVGGDLASELGQELKTASKAAHTTVITMTAGAVGYILPDASYRHNSHGVAGSPLKAGCAETALIQGFKRLEQEAR